MYTKQTWLFFLLCDDIIRNSLCCYSSLCCHLCCFSQKTVSTDSYENHHHAPPHILFPPLILDLPLLSQYAISCYHHMHDHHVPLLKQDSKCVVWLFALALWWHLIKLPQTRFNCIGIFWYALSCQFEFPWLDHAVGWGVEVVVCLAWHGC